jgi:hypothetical protein
MMRLPAASTFQAVNWLEAAIRPNHGEEDLVHSLIVVWAVGQRDAAQIERADLLDGRKQPRPRNPRRASRKSHGSAPHSKPVNIVTRTT